MTQKNTFDDYEPVVVSGVFDYKNEKLLQNRRYKTYVGYRIITPFLLDDGHYVMVDRGWIPNAYNKLNPKEIEDKKGKITLSGVVRVIPPKKEFLTAPLYGTTKRVIKRIDNTAFPMVTEYKNLLIQVSSSGNQNIRSFIEKPHASSKHSGYMLTWASLAILLPLLYGAYLLHGRKS